MKNISILLISVFTTVNISYSQISGLDSEFENLTTSGSRFIKVANPDNNEIEGSAYINKDFVAARISIVKNKVFYARYNAFNDEIEIKGENDIIYGLDKKRKDILIHFSNPKQTYQAFDYNLDNKDLFGYFTKLNFDSEMLLLRKERIIHVEEKISKTTYGTNKPAHFKRAKDKYFIKIGDKSAIELSKNKKDVAKLIPKFENEVLSFIKKNKIKLTNEKDLLKLVEYLNELNSKA